MKLLNKFRFGILLTSMSVLLLATACEDEITRDPSPEYNTSSANVYFASSNKPSVAIGVNSTGFDITVKRENTTTAQTVKLKTESAYGDLFTVPESVTFAAGEAQKVVTITCGDIELWTSYHISIEIDGNETKPYVAQNVYPRIELNVVKEDYEPYANGTYVSSRFYLFTGNALYNGYPLTLEYSEILKNYRLKNTWGYDGYSVTFEWDGASGITMIGNEDSDGYILIQTGFLHPTYGMVSAKYYNLAYDSVNKKFTFGTGWSVSAGEFAIRADYYTITALL